MISYPAVLSRDSDDTIVVEFPDLPGCITYGLSKENAIKMGREALTGYLASVLDRALEVNAPSDRKGADVVRIEPEPSVAFALWLRRARSLAGLSQGEVASRLGVKYQVYQRLEDPSKANPTLKTIVRLEKVFGKRLLTV